MTNTTSYDFVSIGSGPAGQRAAVQAAKLGKKVAIVERHDEVGGVAVHTGTLPSKTLRQAVLYLSGWDQRGLYGPAYRLKEDLSIDDLMLRVNSTIKQETDVETHQLRRNGITILNGLASFAGANSLSVACNDGRQIDLHAEKILIATGTIPRRPDDVPFDGEVIIDSDDVLRMKKLPGTMTVYGAGVIGTEYGSIFGTLDMKVTIIDGRKEMLRFMDEQITDELVHYMRDRGITMRLGERINTVVREGDKAVINLESGKRFASDVVLYAAGRMGATDSLQLEKAGLECDARNNIKVNEFYQTDIAHIYAAGDVIGFPGLASTSAEQGRLAARHAFGESVQPHPELFPFGVYAVPELSMVGQTEEQLTEATVPYVVGVARFRETTRGQIKGLQEGLLKLIFHQEDKSLLGVHVLGEDATELVHIGQAALTLGGGLDFFIENVFNYPTLAEAYKIAALDAANKMAEL